MKGVSLSAALGLAGMLAAAACSSSDRTLPAEDADAGGPMAPSPDADPPDAAAEAGIDAVAPKPLDVTCEGDPCYVGVSGNGSRHVCGLLNDGTVRCWGLDTMPSAPPAGGEGNAPIDGALGRGTSVSVVDGATPATVVGLSSVTQISVGPNFGSCARSADGAVYCWGKNDLGQLGRSSSEPSLPTASRVEGIPPVDEVALGAQIACAVTSSERAVYCWGKVIPGLGVDASEGETFSPRRITTIPGPVKSLAVGTWSGEDTVIAQLGNDTLATVGRAPLGETSTTSPRTSPLDAYGVSRSWTFAFVTTDGLLRRWLPARGPLYVPALAPPVDVKISGSVEGHQGGVLLSTGRLFRWGDNTSGALAVDPASLLVGPHPIEIAQLGPKVVSFATTTGSTCAVLTTGKVMCWGANTFGELGRGTTDTLPHPEPAPIR